MIPAIQHSEEDKHMQTLKRTEISWDGAGRDE